MKITCVMPTKNRPAFVKQAVQCFLDQDYTGDLHLEILDDSPERIKENFTVAGTKSRHIAYTWIDPEVLKITSTGMKRNLANELADGDVIIHWDDDDWSHPSRVQHQIDFLLASGKPLTGYHSYLYWRMSDGAGFMYNQPDFRPHVGGSSMCYLRSAWEKTKFTDRSVGEDFIFTVQVGRENIASQAGGPMLVARAHSANTCHPTFGSRNFPKVPLDKFPDGFLLTLPRSGA